MEVRCRF